MNREGHENVNFFKGIEVEHTPAFGMRTLFVVGLHPYKDIAEHLSGCDHIYFGANMSFPKLRANDGAEWAKWETMIYYFLERDYLCTLDITTDSVEGLLETGFCEYHNFIPMISVKLPYIQQLGYNATINLDDKDFAATKPGVWCHSLHSLQTRNNFTDWSKYTKDETL